MSEAATLSAPTPGAMQPDLITRAELVDALGCFWNAALYPTHQYQDSTANAVMAGMVEGVAAVAERLKVPPPREALRSSLLLEALKALVADVADYPAWQRPCLALERAEAAIRQAEEAA